MIFQIALGSAIGGVARYLLSSWIALRVGGGFPWGTLVVNLTGSFLLGLLVPILLAAPAISPETRAFLTVGFCGGYTTFSAFSAETVRLMESGDYRRASLYVGASVLLALAATMVGSAAGRSVVGLRRS